jgi:hypothetical protein
MCGPTELSTVIADEPERHPGDDDAYAGDCAQQRWHGKEEQDDTGENQPRRASDHVRIARTGRISLAVASAEVLGRVHTGPAVGLFDVDPDGLVLPVGFE